MDARKVKELKEFVSVLEKQPELLHSPELGFFAKYLKSLGAKLPENKKEKHGHEHAHAEKEASHGHQHTGNCCGHDHGHDEKKGGHEHDHAHHSSSEEEEEPDEPEEPEEEDKELMPADDETPAPMGPDEAPELSDAEMDKAGELKMAASEAAGNGDYAKAVKAYSEVVFLTPSPLVYAKRADAFLKLKKPNAAVRDANKALELNSDSAKALRVRGAAYR